MTSVLTSTRQRSPNGSFIALANLTTSVYTPASVLALTDGTGTAVTAWTPPATPAFAAAAGDLFLDMGRTVVVIDPTTGGSLTFQKVQFIDPTTPGTNGVSGTAPGDGSDFNTGYILLGLNGAADNSVSAVVAKVAKYGL